MTAANPDVAQTVEEYMSGWLLGVKKNELKPTSYERLSQVLRYQIFPAIGIIPIAELSSMDVRRLINSLRDEGKSYSVIKKVYNALNACIKTGVIRGELLRNPCLGVSLPKALSRVTPQKIKFYTEDEIEKICKEATRTFSNGKNCYRLGWAVVLLLYTGMRRSELWALEWDEKDIREKVIRIHKNTVEVRGKLINQDTTKTRNGNRDIPLCDMAKESLKHLRETTGNETYVMTTKKGKRVSFRNFDRTFRDICRACGVPANGVHSLRHSFASMLFAKGCDAQVVCELMGHSDPAITRSIYIHVIPQQKHRAIDSLNEFIF